MLTPELLQRLARIRRQWPAQPSPQATWATDWAANQGNDIEVDRVGQLEPQAAQGASGLSGSESTTPCGSHWSLACDVGQIWSDCGGFLRRRELTRGTPLEENEHPELSAMRQAFPEGLLLLDLETCGFAGSMVFLAGLIHQEDQGLRLTQLLARNYAEERAMLYSVWRIAADKRVLVTFNGKSFDWPSVLDRSTVHRLGHDAEVAGQRPPLERGDPRPRLAHCDLLHHCRRRWRHALPNCKLQTLETYICGRRRGHDIPGALIPHVYHAFVRDGDPASMKQVLRHNALDLVTLLQLAAVI